VGDLAGPGEHTLRRAVLAHELGHHYPARRDLSLALALATGDLDASRAETQAQRWGAERLLPASLIQALGRRRRHLGGEETDELAELARVPVAYVAWWVRGCEERGPLLPAWFR